MITLIKATAQLETEGMRFMDANKMDLGGTLLKQTVIDDGF